MQYPIIDKLIYAYLRNGWTGLDIPETIIYEPIQLGNGNPSPDNIRPILPATTLNIGGIDVSVYGGSLEVATGVLTVNRAEVNASSLSPWRYISDSEQVTGFYSFIPSIKTGLAALQNFAPLICEKYATGGIGWQRIANNYIGVNQSASGSTTQIIIKDPSYNVVSDFVDSLQGVKIVYELETATTYQLTDEELYNAIGIKDDIAHRLRLPLVRNFPHPVIDALISAADGQHTEEEKEILRHYLTPLGIGGV